MNKNKTIGIMQPYFLPYIGYFQLIKAVDEFVVYDNIKYTKKGWINRNRLLLDGKTKTFSLPLAHASNFLNICDRKLASSFNRLQFLNQISAAYQKAPFFNTAFPMMKKIINYDETNLFRYLFNSIKEICIFLKIKTKLQISSTINIDHGLKSQHKVIAICRELKANTYINPIGGIDLYRQTDFLSNSIELKFIKSRKIEYHQGNATFLPWLSIMDVLMFNDINLISKMLNEFDMV